MHTDPHSKKILGEIFERVTICNGCEGCPVLTPAFSPTSLAPAPFPESWVTFSGICRFVPCCFRGKAQGLSGQGWVGSRSSTDSLWKLVKATEECEVGPASALIQERFKKYFMPVSSTDFDNVEGRRSRVLFYFKKITAFSESGENICLLDLQG